MQLRLLPPQQLQHVVLEVMRTRPVQIGHLLTVRLLLLLVAAQHHDGPQLLSLAWILLAAQTMASVARRGAEGEVRVVALLTELDSRLASGVQQVTVQQLRKVDAAQHAVCLQIQTRHHPHLHLLRLVRLTRQRLLARLLVTLVAALTESRWHSPVLDVDQMRRMQQTSRRMQVEPRLHRLVRAAVVVVDDAGVPAVDLVIAACCLGLDPVVCLAQQRLSMVLVAVPAAAPAAVASYCHCRPRP